MTMQLFSGMQYLKIDIANQFGHDKLDWDERLDWFQQAEGDLENLVKDAENPALFYAGTLAYRKAQRGIASSHMISLDATASGLQILAVLTGCEKSARLCNIVDAGKRMDAYTALYGSMLQLVGEQAKIKRDDLKDAVMTALYASKAVPKRVFGEGLLLTQFYQTMTTEAPGAWELNESFQALWNSKGLSHDWVLPDGFAVHVKVMDNVKETVHFLNEPFEILRKENMPTKEGRSLGANTNHSVDGMVFREMQRRCYFNPVSVAQVRAQIHSKNCSMNRPRDKQVIKLWQAYEHSGFLSARIIDYIDEKNAGHVDGERVLKLLDTYPKKRFEILGIHDCFRCLPNYGDDLRKQYNQIMSDIAGSELLSYIISQIVGKYTPVNKLGDLKGKALEANYALS